MQSVEYWAKLRKHGFTKCQEISAGGKRRVILQSQDGDFPSIEHPDDLSPEQRDAVYDAFVRKFVL